MDVWGGQDAHPTGVSGIFAVCGRVCGAIVEQVSAIDFGEFMCLCTIISAIVLYL
ncbi:MULTISPECIES: hypothetical protein [unclassified Microcoleus]|uniref:hypothetical protein n=1 Tax=unclassified Microcoleus TaxID=2642155 RepID=UPI002FD6FAC9